ncbi:AAA family ATPase [Candidatus Palauibacter sp.]|uniref:AAA family ATPase n=1 Tax=Candidatus Palauibacter sp. TaxID=3101350 RepID=UPI003B0162E7
MSAHDSDYQRVEVDHFGPIAKADIDLRPLTVLVGASGSGKSYLAKLLYALHRYFSLHLAFKHRSWKTTRFYELARETPDLLGVVEQFEKWLADESSSSGVPCPPEVFPLARESVKGVDTGTALEAELRRIFGVETIQPLILRTRASADIRLDHSPLGASAYPPAFRYVFKLNDGKLEWQLDVEDDAPVRLERSGTFWQRGLVPNFFQRRRPEQSIDGSPINPAALQHVLADLAQPSTVGPFSRAAHYLPASRSGGMETQQLLLRGSLRDMTTAGRRQESAAPPLSGVLADYIEGILIDLPAKPTDWGEGDRLAREVEQTILGGSVRVEKPENGSPRVLFRPAGWEEDLPLARASSMVTEMIPVAVYLRHQVQAGETIIIEEPEAHMHPEMQVRLGAALAKIVAAGIRVIITVHSDWILSALANICRMAELPDEDRGDMAGGDVTLPASQIGVWELVPNERGETETREIVLDSDNGMFDAGYPRIAQALYDDWATIHSRLQED